MKLKLVEIYGFKSFAQRTELSFDKGITGIVGPNGSGKSNIADAVRWVLGEQSAKLLRGAKMEDVIFSGTQTRKPLPYCEVSLLFDNEDRTLNSPYAEVLVTRRAYRSGEGEYYLNKTACRLKDLLELFRDTGIGKEGYSIIGQGRIEEILSARGEDRRQVFEEAAGIVTYRMRKEEAERKLQRTQENLLRLQDIIAELGSRLEPLEAQAHAAREYLRLSQRLKELDLNVFLVRHERLTERINTLRGLTDTLGQAISDHEEQLRISSAEREQIEQQLQLLDQRDEGARAAQKNAQDQVFQAQAALQAEQGHQQSLRDNRLRRQAEAADVESRLLELSNLLSGLHLQVDQQGEGELQAAAALRKEQDKLQSLVAQADQLEQALDAHKERFVAALNRLGDTKAAQARQRAMLEQAERRQEEMSVDTQAARQAKADAKEKATDAERARQQAASALDALTARRDALKHALEELRSAEQARKEKAQELLIALRAMQSRLSVLEDMTRDYEGYASAVKMALRNAQDNPRVYGVVADIIQVPKEYETAIEMILGGALQHIVTQDEETAKELIDYLRNNKLGRTTFLPITAIRSRALSGQEKQLLRGDAIYGPACDLISFDDRFRNVVENLLGRTVIVRDLDAGIRLSRSAGQSFHVVTLAGDVLRAGGAMTGGTSQSRAGSLLGRRREMEELKERIGLQQRQLLDMQEEEKDARKQMEHKAAEALMLDEAVSQQSIVVAREQERLRNAQTAHDKAEQNLLALEEAMLQLKETVATIQAALQEAAEQADHDQVDQKAMEVETAEMQAKLQQARQHTEAQRERVVSMQESHLKLVHEADMLKRDRGRLEKEQAALLQQRERLAAEDAGLIDRMEKAALAVCQAQQALRAAQALGAKCSQAAQGIAAERGQQLARQRACSKRLEEIHALHAQDSAKLHRNELVTARTENELQSLGDYILNTYELTYGAAQQHRMEGKLELPKAELEIKDLKKEIREMGTVHVGAIEEYAATIERYDALDKQLKDAIQARDDLKQLIHQLLGKMETQFKQAFAKLSGFFSETFARLFGGGQAELILTDPSAPLTCDIDILAQPPGKKLQLLSLLSGGERALTAIAILFAMLKLKPTPFCILDEIEAALDEANIGHFADYLSEYAQSTQFIVITHRKGTMERCDALYGVSMEEQGVSSMVSVNLQQYA